MVRPGSGARFLSIRLRSCKGAFPRRTRGPVLESYGNIRVLFVGDLSGYECSNYGPPDGLVSVVSMGTVVFAWLFIAWNVMHERCRKPTEDGHTRAALGERSPGIRWE